MTEQARALQWVTGGDTGVSSKTIWAVMMGAVHDDKPWFYYDTPHDPSDFGRCYRLLKLIPEWKSRLHEVAAKFPKWGPMVHAWAEMERLYERDFPSGRSDQLYILMTRLEDEGFLAAGWVRSGCGWRGGPPS